MESFILAIVIAVFVWLFMRRARMKRAQRDQAQRAATASGDQERKNMPRFGKPGTVTRDQLKALKTLNFEPSRHWSHEEAQVIIDAVTYLRVVIANVTGEGDSPLEVQNKVLGFILIDEALREFILDWRRNQTREEEEAGIDLERTPEYERIAAFVVALWEE